MYVLSIALSHAAAIIKLIGMSTGITLVTSWLLHLTVLIIPFDTPAMIPLNK